MTRLSIKISQLILLLISVFSTNMLVGQTTLEEYNYITKGYKIQLESGLDMKKGYSLTDLGDWGLKNGSENRRCEFKGLVKQGQTKPCAIMMIYKRTDISNGVNYYICIPSAGSSPEIWQLTLDSINANFKDNNSMVQTVIWALMKFSSQEVAK